MRQPNRTSSTEAVPVDESTRQLTNAQRTFADVVGGELARLWNEQQTMVSGDSEHSSCQKPTRRLPKG